MKNDQTFLTQTEIIETNDTELNTITVIENENENLESVMCIREPVKQYSNNNNALPVKENAYEIW